MTKFADQLFDDLMREHGSTLAHTRPPAPRRRIASRRTLLVTGTGFAAAAATVGALMASGGGTTAYALTTHPNGTVTLDVYQKSGIAGINTKLHQVGDGQVVVVPVEPGCPSLSSLPAPAVSPSHVNITTQATSSSDGSVTVDAQGIPPGDILVVAVETTTTGTAHFSGTAGRLTSPPAPSCVSGLPTMPPPPGSGSGSRSGTVTSSGGGSGLTQSGNG
jgi:hypothetical protein